MGKEKMILDYPKLKIFVSIACLLGLTSCACMVRGPEFHAASALGSPPVGGRDGAFWWGYRFKVFWPPEKAPDFTIDLLLAHAVVQPVLSEYQSRIIYWRFHRRAAPDAGGHQFSFLFYSDPITAGEVFRRIGQSKLLSEALAANIVEKIIADDPAQPARPGVEAMSDPHWSPMLQRSWPSFIMGVSSLWLDLIAEAVSEDPGNDLEIHALLERYRKADERVTSVWHKEGQHAFLHHLNAIFGYEPLIIQKEMRF
jgi:hypothetical protein